MNKTRKLTIGAMLLAIIGAIMIIDRQFSYLIGDVLVLAFAIVIIIYSSMYEVKDGLILAGGLAVLTVLFGNITTYLYAPISILLGIAYSIGLKRNLNNQKLLAVAIIMFVIGEYLIFFVIGPLVGWVTIQGQIASMKEALTVYSDTLEKMGQSANAIWAFFTDNIILVLLVASTILIGVMEGFIIHIMSLFLLSRFKIKDVEKFNLLNIRPNPTLAYISIACVSLSFFQDKIENETIIMIVTLLMCFGAVVLLYYGYIFFVIYTKLFLPKRTRLLYFLALIFLFPTSLLALIVLGFLFAAGPLYRKLEEKRKLYEENNHS